MNRQIVLKSRPAGAPGLDNFALVETAVPEPGEGEILVRHSWMSLDPYMRGRMSEARSYAKPVAIGEVMTAGTVFGFDGAGNPVNTIVSSHNTKAGWTVGGGIEGRIAGNWTGKIEYLYLDFGKVSTSAINQLNSTPLAVSLDSRVTTQVARVSVNYKFDADIAWLYD